MAFDSTGEVKWDIPEGYYEQVAQSDVNGLVHLGGRMALAPFTTAMFGRPQIVTSPGFDEAQAEFAEGNIIVASTHRSEWETVIQPATFERVGLHHARPVSKLEPLFQGPVRRTLMHNLGAFAIDKRPGHADMTGLQTAVTGILQRGGIINFYFEGTRVTDNPMDVRTRNIKVGGIVAALLNNSLIVPTALAGISKLTEGKGDAKRTLAKDKRSWFGRNRPLVMAFEDPFRLELPSFDIERLLDTELSRADRRENYQYVREQTEVIRSAMKKALDTAYRVRGSSLEKKK